MNTSLSGSEDQPFRLLHLTDLHLGRPGTPELDPKVEIPGVRDDYTRTEAIAATLQSMASQLRDRGQSLDAIVVSGDITWRGGEEGFRSLKMLLDALGDRRPAYERIVILPGNHDVIWGTPPSSEERYRPFLQVANLGDIKMPYLDGYKEPTINDLEKHYLLDRGRRVAIVPINSANWCGTQTTPNGPTYDIARVSKAQHKFLRKLIAHIRDTAEGEITLVATAHHHLVPVSLDEELKPFEALTNVARLRTLLAEENVRLFLHGHKHFAGTIWDFPAIGVVGAEPLLIASGSTLSGMDSRYGSVAQLVEIGSGVPPRHCRIRPVHLASHGEHIDLGDGKDFVLGTPMQGDAVTEPKTLAADSIDDLYAKVLALFSPSSNRSTEVMSLVCHLRDVPESISLPAAYPPDVSGMGDEPELWLSRIVDWWQKPELIDKGASRFNHGERLDAHDQINRMVVALSRTHKSGRAVAVLLDPERDDISDVEARFPSFSLLQVELLSGSSQTPWTLHAIAYFRKHEMRYWWPINVAEVAGIMRRVVDSLRTKVTGKITIGSITTVSGTAHVANHPTLVAVPRLDLLVEIEDERFRLEKLAYGISHRRSTVNEDDLLELREGWREIAENLTPMARLEDIGDDMPVPLVGLEFLHRRLAQYALLSGDRGSSNLAVKLEHVIEVNREYLGALRDRRIDADWQDSWFHDAQALSKDVHVHAQRLLRSAIAKVGSSHE